MQKFLVFSGTTEGRRALELLAGPGRELWASAATEYGGESLPAIPGLTALTGALGEGEITALLKQERFTCVLDATHPYAAAATKNIRAACQKTGTRLVRVLREEAPAQPPEKPFGAGGPVEQGDFCMHVESAEQAARVLAQSTQGNILLTTGSKELAAFTAAPGLVQRLFPRVLPVPDSLEKCVALGVSVKNIICMQGPFTAELNAAMLKQVGACWLVTKETGAAGGFPEKCAGAQMAGARVLVIGRPAEENGTPLGELPELLRREFGIATPPTSARNWQAALPSGRCPVDSVKILHPADARFKTLPNLPTPARISSGRCPAFPLFVKLAGKTVLVLGGGPIAARRVSTLLGFGCRVRIISPMLCPQLTALLESGEVEYISRKYASGDCAGTALVVAATSSRSANSGAGKECASLGIPISVADCKEESTFYFPGVVQHGGVVVGITASGENHALAKEITRRIREEAPRLIGKNGEEHK